MGNVLEEENARRLETKVSKDVWMLVVKIELIALGWGQCGVLESKDVPEIVFWVSDILCEECWRRDGGSARGVISLISRWFLRRKKFRKFCGLSRGIGGRRM